MNEAVSAAQVAACSVAIFAAAALGGLTPAFRPRSHRHDGFIFSFASGVLLGTAFLHMLPEAARTIGGSTGFAILGGFMLLLLVEKFVMVHPCEEMGCDFHHLGLTAYIGISLHSLIDGLALGAAFTDPRLSVIVFLAMVIHKLPCAFSLGSLLMMGHYSRTRIITLILIYAMMTPIGTVLTWALARNLPQSMVGWALGFSAGTFLFIATSDLLPQLKLHDKRAKVQLVYLLLGLALAGVGVLLEG